MKKTASSLQSPLGRARGLGSARSGTHHWIMLRLTSFSLLLLALYPLGRLFLCPEVNGSYASIVAWLHKPFAAAGVILFLAIAFHHAASGLQVVIEDYVHCKCARPALIFFVKFGSAAFALTGILATIKIMLGV